MDMYHPASSTTSASQPISESTQRTESLYKKIETLTILLQPVLRPVQPTEEKNEKIPQIPSTLIATLDGLNYRLQEIIDRVHI